VTKRNSKPAAPDVRRMEQAVSDFLKAAGLDVRADALRQTPHKVAQAWAAEFLAGYRQTAAEALKERYPLKKAEGSAVVITDLWFRSACPHHLLPYSGRAHIAFVPGKYLIGFGQISELLGCFAHRLLLQEVLAPRSRERVGQRAQEPRRGMHHRSRTAVPATSRE
jgi:GTP cyclohydrolase IA